MVYLLVSSDVSLLLIGRNLSPLELQQIQQEKKRQLQDQAPQQQAANTIFVAAMETSHTSARSESYCLVTASRLLTNYFIAEQSGQL